MRTVWKYDIPKEQDFHINLPKGAEFLTIALQGTEPKMWFLVNDKKELFETRHFKLIGTGIPIDESLNLQYLGTFLVWNDTIVIHVFEVEK